MRRQCPTSPDDRKSKWRPPNRKYSYLSNHTRYIPTAIYGFSGTPITMDITPTMSDQCQPPGIQNGDRQTGSTCISATAVDILKIPTASYRFSGTPMTLDMAPTMSDLSSSQEFIMVIARLILEYFRSPFCISCGQHWSDNVGAMPIVMGVPENP